MNIDLLCHACGAFFIPLKHQERLKGCSCGVRIPMKEIIKISDYITASGRYMDRLQHSELTDEVKDNARKLLAVVNQLLDELGIKSANVTSGFRPSNVNKNTPGAAKKSLHQQGLAVDMLDDKDQTLAKLIQSKPEMLKKYNLWLEDPEATVGKQTCWVHLDLGSRVDRPSRTFKP